MSKSRSNSPIVEPPAGRRRAFRVLTWEGSDAELLDQVATTPSSGASNVAARLFDRFESDISRLIRAVLGEDAALDRLLQSVLVKLWRDLTLGRLQVSSSLPQHVGTLSLRCVRKELWVRKLRRPKPALLPPEDSARNTLVAQADAAYRMLDTLRPLERIVFALHHLDQRRLGEVADLTGLRATRARPTLSRAEERLCSRIHKRPDLALVQGALDPQAPAPGIRIRQGGAFHDVRLAVLEHLTSRTAELLATETDPERRKRQRDRFIATISRPRTSSARLQRPVVLAALFAAGTSALGSFAWIAWGSPWWDSSSASGAVLVGQDIWLEGPVSSGVPLRAELSDGVVVRLEQGARGRSQRTSGKRARVTVENGRMQVSVTPGTDLSWSFYAGAYRVDCDSGVFSMEYASARSALEVRVEFGEVRLSGGRLDRATATLDAGQLFQIGDTPNGAHASPAE